jgi:hypothetical protein
MRPNHESVLRALTNGQRITVQGKQYVMDVDYRLCQVMWDQDGNEHYAVVNMGEGVSLSWFIHWCEKTPESDILLIGANMALAELNSHQ